MTKIQGRLWLICQPLHGETAEGNPWRYQEMVIIGTGANEGERFLVRTSGDDVDRVGAVVNGLARDERNGVVTECVFSIKHNYNTTNNNGEVRRYGRIRLVDIEPLSTSNR